MITQRILETLRAGVLKEILPHPHHSSSNEGEQSRQVYSESCWKGCHREDGGKLFSVAPKGRIRTKGLKLNQREFSAQHQEALLDD